MKFLRDMLDKQRPLFEKGGKFEKLHPLFEANETFLFTPGRVTDGPSHVRDGIDLKRMMTVVVVALLPCMAMAMYNTGYQANLAIEGGAAAWAGWQTSVYEALGLPHSSSNFFACLIYGALFFLPIYIMTLAAGGFWEVLFAIVRKHEVNEGFLVTSALFPLVLPPTIPLWQVALGISFGVVLGKEIFGGTGMNIFNPALVARAFLFFAYPAQISGDFVWIAAKTSADGYSGATWLSRVAAEGGGVAVLRENLGWWDAFLGFEPGSMGETSALFCIFGAVVLIATGVGSWRTMAGCLLGSFVLSTLLNLVGSETNLAMNVPFYWHWVIGSFAFATVFMATDPVSSAFTDRGKWIYGAGIGVMGILVRVLNPAYPEGWMLAILFMNMFAPLIDHFIVKANIKRRLARSAA
ncbi:MAG: NADH:ubiquinone reductase (Na(+)-transporting) subunit B [Candidatus Hydrogenedentes bacterium]|nr:NADH:ubiquinone reductase (Na(+)-transporting) subunit B [Candidatus Hydrogenedentota bacterium]